jgi:hypothetical protein
LRRGTVLVLRDDITSSSRTISLLGWAGTVTEMMFLWEGDCNYKQRDLLSQFHNQPCI